MNNGVDLSHATTETVGPSQKWHDATEEQRRTWVRVMAPPVVILHCHANGQVVVSLTSQMTAAERGPLLLRIEAELRRFVDPGLTVYLEPQADKNAIRHFRGVVVKEWES